MKREELESLPILYARQSYHGDDIHIRAILGKERAVLVYYKDEFRKISMLTERVPEGTYNQKVDKVPYIVIEEDVYPLDTFNIVNHE
ncbi:hypothetical protein [Bacillus cereus]|uniref:hypothetical protein n=1 Tax=Bacillus cereus TaxID=1396 RepID=UPI001C8BD383|nr:hypothetical protein [Bacillus cereus]MBX9158291.1 hypothetical protein [Bacillus cereus]